MSTRQTRTLLIIILLLIVVMVVIAGGSKKKLSTEEAYKILAGTWMNEEYSESFKGYKFIIQPDGTYKGFQSASTDAFTTGRLTILDTMIDLNGTIWIKAVNDFEKFYRKVKIHELQKYSNSNMTMEVFSSKIEDWYGEGFPADIEPGDNVRYMYSIYYRQ